MKLKIKDQIPDTEIFQLIDGEPQKSKLREVIGNGKIILFGLPGAFTSTCSKLHLPGFVANADRIKAKGIEKIFCLSVEKKVYDIVTSSKFFTLGSLTISGSK